MRVLPVKALAWGLQDRSGENDCEGGMIPTSWREGVVPGGQKWEQGSVGKGQVKNCGAMIGGEREPSVDPGVLRRKNNCADALSK